MNNDKASRSRKKALESAQTLVDLVRQTVTERGPVLRGAFQLRGTRCGKDGCKCNQGELHTTAVLIVSEGGKRRSYYVRPVNRPEVQRRVDRYLRFRGKRRELGRLSEEVLSATDDLLAAIAEPHSPQKGADSSAHTGGRSRARRKR